MNRRSSINTAPLINNAFIELAIKFTIPKVGGVSNCRLWCNEDSIDQRTFDEFVKMTRAAIEKYREDQGLKKADQP